MKIYDSHYDKYIEKNSIQSLHPKLNKLYLKIPENINKLQNIIFYGPKGVGKYTQMLTFIKKI